MKPTDIIVPVEASSGKPETDYRTAILRLDTFLGEWQSPEYYENITPPPASSLMIGTAKAEVLKREDYTAYTEPVSANPKPRQRTSSLWAGSPSPNRSRSPGLDGASPFSTADLSSALTDEIDETTCYIPLRPTFAISGGGKIPDGFVAHARDECLTVDCQWDSSRGPNDFGDGGTLPEEWTSMHKRFRRGVKRLLNWYATTESPTALTSVSGKSVPKPEDTDEDIETVVILVSHGAGCNALIGAITHQPVLMDVGLASITLGTRKEELDYAKEAQSVECYDDSGRPLVPVDAMYDIRISASSEHLRNSLSTPISSRSSSTTVWNGSSRGRTSTAGSSTHPAQMSTVTQDSHSPSESRSCSASFTVGSLGRTSSTSKRTGLRMEALTSTGLFTSSDGNSSNTGGSPTIPSPSQPGLWRPTPAPSSLRLMDDGTGDDEKENDGFPNFDQSRLSRTFSLTKPRSNPPDFIDEDDTAPRRLSNGPLLAAPIKIKTSWGDKNTQAEKKVPQEVKITQLGDSTGALWGQPSTVQEAGHRRDMTQAKRRWTVTEKSI